MRSYWMIFGLIATLATACQRGEINRRWIDTKIPYVEAELQTYTSIDPTDSAVLHNRQIITERLNKILALDTTGWAPTSQVKWEVQVDLHQAAMERLDNLFRNPLYYSPFPGLDSVLVASLEYKDYTVFGHMIHNMPEGYANAMRYLSDSIDVETYQYSIQQKIKQYGRLDSICQVHPTSGCEAALRSMKTYISFLESRKHEQSLRDQTHQATKTPPVAQ